MGDGCWLLAAGARRWTTNFGRKVGRGGPGERAAALGSESARADSQRSAGRYQFRVRVAHCGWITKPRQASSEGTSSIWPRGCITPVALDPEWVVCPSRQKRTSVRRCQLTTQGTHGPATLGDDDAFKLFPPSKYPSNCRREIRDTANLTACASVAYPTPSLGLYQHGKPRIVPSACLG